MFVALRQKSQQRNVFNTVLMQNLFFNPYMSGIEFIKKGGIKKTINMPKHYKKIILKIKGVF